MKEWFTISVYSENNVGLLNRISGIFLKRHINIEGLNVSKSDFYYMHLLVYDMCLQMLSHCLRPLLGTLRFTLNERLNLLNNGMDCCSSIYCSS